MFFRQIFDVRAARPLDILKTDSRKYTEVLKIISIICVAIMACVQIYLLFTHISQPTSDAKQYIDLAKNAYENGVWYPSELNIHDTYLFGNGLVNILILFLKLTSSITPIYALNFICVYVILFSCVHILKKLIPGSQTVYYFVIIFSLTASFWAEVTFVHTDLLFTAAAFLSFALLYSKKGISFILSGVLLAFAGWVRPLAIVFLIGGVWILINNRSSLKRGAAFVLSFAIAICAVGTLTYISFGHFEFQSTTGSYNLIMGAFDGADGTSEYSVFDEGGSGYIPPEEKAQMTYEEIGDFYKEQALNWIKKNPGKYLALMPKKFFVTMYSDTYACSAFYGEDVKTMGTAFYKGIISKVLHKSSDSLSLADIASIYTEAFYLLTLCLGFTAIIILLVKRRAAAFMPFIFTSAGVVGTTVLVVGGPRYHLPMLPILIMAAALTVQCIFIKLNRRRAKNEKLH